MLTYQCVQDKCDMRRQYDVSIDRRMQAKRDTCSPGLLMSDRCAQVKVANQRSLQWMLIELLSQGTTDMGDE